MTGSATNHLTNRRGFLKIAAAGTAAALSRPLPAGAAEKTITILHESSFIKPFDEYVENTLAPAYEKATGIKVDYEVISVGSLPTRISTAAETGSGADMTMIGLLQAVPVRRQVRRRQRHRRRDRQGAGRLVRRRQGSGGRQRQMEGDPVRQYRPADELAHRLVRRGRRQEVPGDLGRALRSRHEAEGQGPSVRLRARPRLRRQPRLALSAAVVVRRRARSRPTARPSSSIPTRPRAPSISAASSSRRPCSRTASAGPTSATTRPGWRSRSPAPTMPRASCGSPRSDFPDIGQGHRPVAEPEGAEGALPPARTRSAIRSSTSRRTSRRRKDFLRWLMEPKQVGRLVRRRRSAITSRSCTAMTTRRCGRSSRATCPTAMRSQDAHLPGWPAPLEPAAGGERRQIRRRRHVRQGLRRQVDQGRHQGRRGAAEADLSSSA